MGAIPSPRQENVISHGICPECLNKVFAEMGIELVNYLDRIDSPVLVVDSDGAVKAANRKALDILDKDGAVGVENQRAGIEVVPRIRTAC
jgi:sensor histidine kinase regulating citrate/malate metabolism